MSLTSTDGDDICGPIANNARNEAYFRFHLKRIGVSLLPDTPLGLWALDDAASSHSRTRGSGSSCPQHVLVKLAIWGSPDKRLTSEEINEAVVTRFPNNELDVLCPKWKASFRYARWGDPLMVRKKRNRVRGDKDRGGHWVLDYRSALRAAEYKFGLPLQCSGNTTNLALSSTDSGTQEMMNYKAEADYNPTLTDANDLDEDWEWWAQLNSAPMLMNHCLGTNPNCAAVGECFCGTIYLGGLDSLDSS